MVSINPTPSAPRTEIRDVHPWTAVMLQPRRKAMEAPIHAATESSGKRRYRMVEGRTRGIVYEIRSCLRPVHTWTNRDAA
jgi:hypothetical protein